MIYWLLHERFALTGALASLLAVWRRYNGKLFSMDATTENYFPGPAAHSCSGSL